MDSLKSTTPENSKSAFSSLLTRFPEKKLFFKFPLALMLEKLVFPKEIELTFPSKSISANSLVIPFPFTEIALEITPKFLVL